APNLQLKIIAHCGDLQYMEVQGKRKPFGNEVIQAHRLMKNSVKSDNYTLLSNALVQEIRIPKDYQSVLYSFENGADTYDGQNLSYFYSIINKENLKIDKLNSGHHVSFDHPAPLKYDKVFPLAAPKLLEYISNFRYRKHWVKGVDDFEFNENENTRLGTEHVCVINKDRLNFVTVTKKAEPGDLVYGEMTTTPPPVDELYAFYTITPLAEDSCRLTIETYWKAKSPLKKLMIALVVKKFFRKNAKDSLKNLYSFVTSA
ncbi:MAG: DUF2652 domain-containing protein, partial [Bacteroidia bacterium]|nr:DUF2652 domain-containing protein [Bacteroidia bacterium]